MKSFRKFFSEENDNASDYQNFQSDAYEPRNTVKAYKLSPDSR